jgi:outer membrane protein insertion porin family
MLKKFVLVILIFLTINSFLSAQDQEAQWWLGKPIFSIQFEGLVHVDETELREITNGYLGKLYENSLFTSLQSELFNLQYFAYFSAEAGRGEDNDEDLIITFQFVELPIIEKQEIIGNKTIRIKDIEEILTIGVGSFATSAKIKDSEAAIRELYLSKGYTSVDIVSDMVTDTESNTIDLTITIDEGLQSKISTISFEGNEHFSENTLKKIIVSKQQSLFNPGNYIENNIEEDKQAILTYFKERGYVDVVITNVSISETDQTDPSKNMLEITFIIEEGDEWKFVGIDIIGNTILAEDAIQNAITHEVGKPLNIVKIQQNISDIAKLYWNDGYVASKIDTQETKNEADRTVSYTMTITEGTQSSVEDIVIKGFDKTNEFVLYRELDIHPGDIFSIDKLFSSMRNMYNTGIIDDVSYEILYGSEEDAVVLEISIIESNKVDLEFGATFGGTEEFPVSGFFSWTDKNFLGNGQDFSIGINISPASQTLDFSFQETWLMNQRWSGGISLAAGHYLQSNILQDYTGIIFSQDDYMDGVAAPDPYNSYEEYQAALAAGMSVPESTFMSYDQYKFTLGLSSGYTFHTDLGRLTLGGSTNVALSYINYDNTLYRPYNPIIRNNLNDWKFTNKIGLNFSWDGRDLIENTTTGFLFQELISYAGGVIGGTSNYIKTNTSLSGYATIFEIPRDDADTIKGVISAKSAVSTIFPQFFSNNGSWEWGIGATQSEKLYIDGMNVARGRSPLYNLEFLWDNTFEFSMPISEKVVWAEAYVSATGYKSDLADVNNLGISDFYFGTGMGIRLAIPGFPLGLYLTKNFYIDDGIFHWVPGDILANPDNDESGFKLVLAITTSIY